MSHYPHAVKPNPSFAAKCRESMAAGKSSELPHNWQARLTVPELRSVFKAKFVYMSSIAARKEKMPRNWDKGLTEEQKEKCYKLRGFGSDAMERQKKSAYRVSSKNEWLKSHGGVRTQEVMQIAHEKRVERRDYIESKRKAHRMARVAARHYDECKPVRCAGRFMIVPGTFRGHKPFYGSNYFYFDCEIIYFNGVRCAIRFLGQTPTEFYRCDYIKEIDAYKINGVVAWCNVINNFSRFKFDLHYKYFSREMYEFKINEKDMKYQATHDWFDDVREEIVLEAIDRHCRNEDAKAWKYVNHSEDWPRIPIVIRGRMLSALKKYGHKEFWRIKKIHECGICSDLHGTAKESARQLRALGFVA